MKDLFENTTFVILVSIAFVLTFIASLFKRTKNKRSKLFKKFCNSLLDATFCTFAILVLCGVLIEQFKFSIYLAIICGGFLGVFLIKFNFNIIVYLLVIGLHKAGFTKAELLFKTINHALDDEDEKTIKDENAKDTTPKN